MKRKSERGKEKWTGVTKKTNKETDEQSKKGKQEKILDHNKKKRTKNTKYVYGGKQVNLDMLKKGNKTEQRKKIRKKVCM